jgi:hypothetical protein
VKQFLAVGLLLIGASFIVSGQTAREIDEQAEPACKMTLAQAPVTNGIKLGMTRDQVLALFPGSREDSELRASLYRPANPSGETTFSINPERYASKAKFPRVTLIRFTLMDDHVSSFNVSYDGPQWAHVDEFIEKLSAVTKLPGADAWDPYVGMDTQLKTLTCKGFVISLFAGGKNVHNINYVELKDRAAQKLIKERRAKAREKRNGWWGDNP